MNPNLQLKKVFASSVDFKKNLPNIKIKLKYKKKSLNKILKDINKIKHELFDDKGNNIFNYNYNNFNRPKNYEDKLYNNNKNNNIILENENYFLKEDNKNNLTTKNKENYIKWNYSYYLNNKNKKKFLKRNLSYKKERINYLINKKIPYIIEDYKKPKMIQILEKNSVIEEEIISKPWKFIPYKLY